MPTEDSYWEDYRLPDGSIDVTAAWMNLPNGRFSSTAENFLDNLQDLRPIKSRQIAAIAITVANTISELREVD